VAFFRDCSSVTGADLRIARQEQGESTRDPLDDSELAPNSANGSIPSQITRIAPKPPGNADPVPFFLFILVNATLFIRPAELVPALEAVPIYLILIIACLAISLPAVLEQMSPRRLVEQPISACVVGILIAVVLSHLAHADLLLARTEGFEFSKVALYYFLLIGVLDSPGRLRSFLTWLAIFIIILTGLALIHYHGIAEIPALKALERTDYDEKTGEQIIVLQLMSTGIYNDPNDLCLILVAGIMISAYQLSERRIGLDRLLWLAPIGMFTYALILTKSRGGFLALLGSFMVLFTTRFGWRRAIPLAVIVLPAMFLLSGGRQTRISADEDSAQSRILLWSDGFALLKQSPLTGIGANKYGDYLGNAAHNSFVHAYTELGILGGTFFLGAWYLPLWMLHRLGTCRAEILAPDLRGFRPFLMAMVAGYAIGILSLSRNYVVPTYMVVGLAVVFIRVAPVAPPEMIPRLSGRLVRRLIVVGIYFMIILSIFIKLTAKYVG